MSSDAKKILNLLAMLFGAWPFLFAQQPVIDSFPRETAMKIMDVLAGDSLRGRRNMTVDLLRAGTFILNEFRQAGLQPLPGKVNFLHEFYPQYPPVERLRDELEWNGKWMVPDDFVFFKAEPVTFLTRDLHSFTVIHLDSFSKNTLEFYNHHPGDLLLWSESPADLAIPVSPLKGIAGARLLVHAQEAPVTLKLTANPRYYGLIEYNIVATIPGKTKPEECILFSAHYDHNGIVKGKDSIMNGANDNASGTTALIMLAQYFAMRNDNERTLIFCAFAGEEIGLRGSTEMERYLGEQFRTLTIKAGINLEMLGLPQYGQKKVFITGERYSTLPAILKKGLKVQGIKVIHEPSEEKRLFRRSDNYPFVKTGIPAHTIMASDDDEPCYHRPCDEIKRMDMSNLCLIARAVAAACAGLINGKDTPGELRVPDWPD
jgi:hypothetical protein